MCNKDYDPMTCEVCDSENYEDYYGIRLCKDCIAMEENTDWDKFEEDKRRKISEDNEY